MYSKLSQRCTQHRLSLPQAQTYTLLYFGQDVKFSESEIWFVAKKKEKRIAELLLLLLPTNRFKYKAPIQQPTSVNLI